MWNRCAEEGEETGQTEEGRRVKRGSQRDRERERDRGKGREEASTAILAAVVHHTGSVCWLVFRQCLLAMLACLQAVSAGHAGLSSGSVCWPCWLVFRQCLLAMLACLQAVSAGHASLSSGSVCWPCWLVFRQCLLAMLACLQAVSAGLSSGSVCWPCWLVFRQCLLAMLACLQAVSAGHAGLSSGSVCWPCWLVFRQCLLACLQAVSAGLSSGSLSITIPISSFLLYPEMRHKSGVISNSVFTLWLHSATWRPLFSDLLKAVLFRGASCSSNLLHGMTNELRAMKTAISANRFWASLLGMLPACLYKSRGFCRSPYLISTFGCSGNTVWWEHARLGPIYHASLRFDFQHCQSINL